MYYVYRDNSFDIVQLKTDYKNRNKYGSDYQIQNIDYYITTLIKILTL